MGVVCQNPNSWRLSWQFVLVFLVLSFCLEAFAAPDRTQERKDYAAAQKALSLNQLTQYRQLKAKLTDYPLFPYLEYEELERKLNRLPRAEVESFLERYPDSYLADKLAQRWLRALASQQQWDQYRLFYHPRFAKDAELACHALQARLKTGDLTALDEVESLWNIDRSQDKACDPVFAQWIDAGRLTPQLIWERHLKALTKGNRSLASWLERQLPPAEQKLAQLLRETDANPRLLSQTQKFSAQSAQMREVILYGLHKLARQDSLAALKLWRGYDAQQLFSDQERKEVQYQLASRLIGQQHTEAAEQLLSNLTEITRSDLTERMIREALRRQDWEKVYEWIARLPQELQDSERWTYWHARTMEALNILELNGRSARDLYVSLAPQRNFYGFLAADKLGYEYGLMDRPMPISDELVAQVEAHPGIQRAREFYVLGQIVSANREWYHTTRQMQTEEKVAAGRLANRWGWHRQGIQAMVDAQHWDDLQVRFPLAYQEQVSQAAEATAINPLLLYAIARQESAFTPDARSPVGATGLMQLMPATAKQTARSSGLSFSPADLLQPEKNIALGSRYLNQLLGQFGGNRILAAAAYNAGPHRVRQWLTKEDAKLPYDIWIETIPFQETRGYVQNVLSFSVIYAYRTGAKHPLVTQDEAKAGF
jgi:soluble lytic murein transglycosylase